MSAITLRKRVAQLVKQHGSVRKAARVLEMDSAYLYRIGSGEMTNPSDYILKRMGLKRSVIFEETSK
jgi:hypothetical protein